MVSVACLLLACMLSHVKLFATPWTIACYTPLAMAFSGENTGVDCYFLLQGIFLTRGLNPCLYLASPALKGGFFTTMPPGKP